MTFDEIQKRVAAEWEALQRSEKPRIFVGAATCGRSAGALSVLETINAETAKRGIEAIVTQVGCIGLCYAEPIIDITKTGRPRILYSSVTPEIATQLIEDYIINDNPRPDLALGTIGDGTIEGIPRFYDLPMLKPQVRIVLKNCGHMPWVEREVRGKFYEILKEELKRQEV